MAVKDQLFIHVPTAGDHYSPRTGSAAMSVIYKLSCEHAARGGETHVVVGRGTCVGYPPYPVGKVVEADLPAWIPPRHKRAADAVLGRLFCLRPFTGGAYSPVADAIARDTRATVFVHTIAPAVPYLRRLLPNARICLYIHNQVLGRYGRREMESLVRACDVVIGVSKFIADDFEMRLGRPDKKVRYLLNGVDTGEFSPAPRTKGGEPATIAFVGRVLPVKGVDLLLRAANLLAGRGLDFRIRIVGSENNSAAAPLSTYERSLREIAAPLGAKVEFHPCVPREQVPDEYRRADILCVPSTWDEPCPLALLEGMASGLPIVASRRGGIPELGGDSVLYFDPPDVEVLAGHLAMLVSDMRARNLWGEKSRKKALASTWSDRYMQLLDVLKS